MIVVALHHAPTHAMARPEAWGSRRHLRLTPLGSRLSLQTPGGQDGDEATTSRPVGSLPSRGPARWHWAGEASGCSAEAAAILALEQPALWHLAPVLSSIGQGDRLEFVRPWAGGDLRSWWSWMRALAGAARWSRALWGVPKAELCGCSTSDVRRSISLSDGYPESATTAGPDSGICWGIYHKSPRLS